MRNNMIDRKKCFKSISEIKSKDNNLKLQKDIKSLLNKKNNNNSHSMHYYLIKYFADNKFELVPLEVLLNYIISIFKTNPKSLVTNSNEEYKNLKSLKMVFRKIINKNIIFVNTYDNNYKINEKEALSFLKPQPNNTNLEKYIYKTPVKLRTKAKRIISLDDSKDNKKLQTNRRTKNHNNKITIKKESVENSKDKKHIKIKKEELSIKEENIPNDEKLKIKKEDIRIKEETNIKEENNDDNEFNLNKIVDLFNDKLYDTFYVSFSEQGYYEQLQEQIEKFLSKNLDDKNYSPEIINKIKEIQLSLEDLNKNKSIYDELISEFEENQKNVIFFLDLLNLEYNEVKYAKELMKNEDLKKYKMDEEAKNIYNFDKEKHDEVYDKLIKSYTKIKEVMTKSEKIKDCIKNNYKEIVENKNVVFEGDDFKDFVDNLNNENNTSLERKIKSEQTFQKYNQYLKEFDEKIKQLLVS